MKGFLGILKKIATLGLGVGSVVAPLVGIPMLAPIFKGLQDAIIAAEATHADGQGGLKAAAVKADFEAGLELTQESLALAHKKLVYDDALLQKSIDDQVAAYNSMAKLKASFKVVDL